jgi:hypothetical protein
MRYSNDLADNEIMAQEQYKKITNFVSEKNIDINTLKRSAFSIKGYGIEPIFDGLAYVFTHTYNAAWTDINGNQHPVIGRRNNPSESHYQIIMKINTFHKYAYGGYPEVIKQEKTNLSKLAAEGIGKKVFLFKDGSSYYTDPLRISFWTKKDAVKEKMIDVSAEEIEREARRYYGLADGVVKGVNEYIIIEIFKPLFDCLLEPNKKGSIGGNFIQVFPSIYAELFMMINGLKDDEKFKVKDNNGHYYDIAAKEARLIYFYLARHDNRKGEYIDIDGLDLALSCFPSFVRVQGDKLEFRHKEGFGMRAKIKKAIMLFKELHLKNKMAEGQFIPIELDENCVQYQKDEKMFRIRVKRPDNKYEFKNTLGEDVKNFSMLYSSKKTSR